MKNGRFKDYIIYVVLIFILVFLIKLDNKIQVSNENLRRKTIIDTMFIVDTTKYNSMDYINY